MNTRNSTALDLRNPADLVLWLNEREGQDILDRVDAALVSIITGKPSPHSLSDHCQRDSGYTPHHFFSDDDE